MSRSAKTTDRAFGDDLRAGLSFAREVALLLSLRLGVGLGGGGLPARVSGPLARLLPGERLALGRSLIADLVERPAHPRPHPEWREATLAGMPSYLRRPPVAAGFGPPFRTPWLRSRWPLVSGRARRAPGEPSHLALLDPPAQQRVLDGFGGRATRHLASLLGPRERALYRGLLGRWADAPDPRGSASLDEPAGKSRSAGSDELSHCLRRALGRAAAGARDEDHLARRLLAQLLATSLGHEHRVELSAIAATFSLRDGQRLMRYHRREAGRWPASRAVLAGWLAEALSGPDTARRPDRAGP